MALGISFTYLGPLFSGGATAKLEAGISRAVQKVAEVGELKLKLRLRKRPNGVYLANGKSTGNYRRNVKSELQGQLSVIITDGGVVYGPWLEGISSRNSSTRFKGYSVFRKTTQELQKEAPGIVEAQLHLTTGGLQ